MSRVYLGLGSNLGDREGNIKKSILLLSEHCKIIKCSSLYETEPIGYKEQGWFLNGVLSIETSHQPMEFLKILHNIENNLGRIRRIKNGPRVIDLDLLFYGDEVICQENLIVPHPELHKRSFVLTPLAEIAPHLIHPIFKKSIRELADSCKEITKNIVRFFEVLP